MAFSFGEFLSVVDGGMREGVGGVNDVSNVAGGAEEGLVRDVEGSFVIDNEFDVSMGGFSLEIHIF